MHVTTRTPHTRIKRLIQPYHFVSSCITTVGQLRQRSYPQQSVRHTHAKRMDRCSTSFPTRSSPEADGRYRHAGQATAAASRQDDSAYGVSGAVVGSMDSIRGMSLREANRIHCKATRERTRERERLLREVTNRMCCIVVPAVFHCSIFTSCTTC